MKIFHFISLLVLTLFISSCEKGVGYKTDLYKPNNTSNSDTIVFAQVSELFNSYGCIGCHSGSYPFGNFNLDVPLADLINLKSNLIDMKIITPSKPKESALYLALLGDGGMTKMPQNGQMDIEDIKTIKKWIEQGALEN